MPEEKDKNLFDQPAGLQELVELARGELLQIAGTRVENQQSIRTFPIETKYAQIHAYVKETWNQV